MKLFSHPSLFHSLSRKSSIDDVHWNSDFENGKYFIDLKSSYNSKVKFGL